MSTDDTTSAGGRHTARKNAARDLHDRTGMPYAAALRQVTRAESPWRPRYRWTLTEDLSEWIDGRTWRGAACPDLRAWLDDEVSPAFDCNWCDEPGNAELEDCSIELLISAYDPDLNLATEHIGLHKYHARCKALRDASPLFGRAAPAGTSSISWLRKVPDFPGGPHRIGLPASHRPEVSGEFDLEARALLAPGWRNSHTGKAVLLITVRVAEDHGQGARAWLTELELHLNGEGLGHPDSLAGGECDWALRIVTGDRPWIALRTGQHQHHGQAPRHLLLSAMDLPDGWASAARRDGQVTVAIGPCTTHWDDISPFQGELTDDLEDMLESSGQVNEAAAECACAGLTAGHVADLIDAGVLVTAGVRVIAEDEA